MPIKDFTGASFDDYGVTVPLYPNVTDDIDVYQLPSSMRDGSDVLDTLIQLDLVKNQTKDKKKNKDEGQTFLDSYLA